MAFAHNIVFIHVWYTVVFEFPGSDINRTTCLQTGVMNLQAVTEHLLNVNINILSLFKPALTHKYLGAKRVNDTYTKRIGIGPFGIEPRISIRFSASLGKKVKSSWCSVYLGEHTACVGLLHSHLVGKISFSVIISQLPVYFFGCAKIVIKATVDMRKINKFVRLYPVGCFIV